MKKILFILTIALLGTGRMAAQDDYTPFVREGVQWVCYLVHYMETDYLGFPPGQTFFTLEIKGDTVIDGKSYKAMHKFCGDAIDPMNDTILVYLREEGRIVYGIIPEGKSYPGYVVGYGELDGDSGTDIYSKAASGEEFILYEFNETESYYKNIYHRLNGISYLGLDKVQVDGIQVNRHHFKNYYKRDFYFIEGIGYDGYCCGYPLSYLCDGGSDLFPFYLSHVIKDGKIIYKSVNYKQVGPYDGKMPLAREGMQWVFEKVTIDHGVTTSKYYTYELRGSDPRGLPTSENFETGFIRALFCRYYDGMKPDGSDGEIVASLKEEIIPSSTTWFIDNTVMDKVASEGRNLIRRYYVSDDPNDRRAEMPYLFDHSYPERIPPKYINRQLSPRILTADNFQLVDPIEIEGYSCNRYAYVDESGEVQCYIIEGIGIDSRDMGDLLAPFTRKPDPEADYQEYCGLSHVIMDGKIIYKGMRYNADAVEGNPYDVDGDGQVTISDVTALIDLLLGGNGMLHLPQHADVDNSGQVNISDVTTLIDYLLNE